MEKTLKSEELSGPYKFFADKNLSVNMQISLFHILIHSLNTETQGWNKLRTGTFGLIMSKLTLIVECFIM